MHLAVIVQLSGIRYLLTAGPWRHACLNGGPESTAPPVYCTYTFNRRISSCPSPSDGLRPSSNSVPALSRVRRQPRRPPSFPGRFLLGGNDKDKDHNSPGSHQPTSFSMGIASLEPRFRPALPDTPPEVLTPDSASFPSRQSEERSWNPRAPPSPPMSNYDPSIKGSDMSSSRKGSEETSARSEASTDQSAPRQQLPPLSSIFGPPSQMHSLHSPYGERPGSYTSSSPLDRPPSLGLGSSSYFPPSTTASASQPRSMLDSRFQDRPQIPPLSRIFPGPLSPQPRPDLRQDGRSGFGSGGRWSAQHEVSREHQLYQPAVDRYHAPQLGMGRDEIRRSDFRDQLSPQTPAQNPPSTPTSSVTSEAPPSKDGLGPKIWTGTHFLPRFVRAAEVPGEGMCYFYDDGSHCKTVIDGEAVNAHWGVTKAGKPRKRLAIACVTCREKKIKCDPDYPRCVQCEKFGRVCKFKNA